MPRFIAAMFVTVALVVVPSTAEAKHRKPRKPPTTLVCPRTNVDEVRCTLIGLKG